MRYLYHVLPLPEPIIIYDSVELIVCASVCGWTDLDDAAILLSINKSAHIENIIEFII